MHWITPDLVQLIIFEGNVGRGIGKPFLPRWPMWFPRTKTNPTEVGFAALVLTHHMVAAPIFLYCHVTFRTFLQRQRWNSMLYWRIVKFMHVNFHTLPLKRANFPGQKAHAGLASHTSPTHEYKPAAMKNGYTEFNSTLLIAIKYI